MEDFFSQYLGYTEGGEVPVCFHRWSSILGISALLERNTHLTFGHSDIYPNIYSMLIGVSGTRKTTAIKLIRKLLAKTGYTAFAAEKTSKEKYLADLGMYNSGDGDDILFGSLNSNSSLVTPSFIVADEANDFFGINNLEFLSLLGSLWDWEGKYENKTKSSKSDYISNPTISILSGNTPTNFSLAFPPAIVGQGFFSRLLIIYGQPNEKRITIPRTPSLGETNEIVKTLQRIKMNSVGLYEYTPTAMRLIDKIYQNFKPILDPRFESYCSRRLVHLLKICLVVAAGRMEKNITETTVIQANTYLSYIESLMPIALGQFGKGKDSDVSHKVLNLIQGSNDEAVGLKQIWKHVDKDLNAISDLSSIIQKLLFAEKILSIPGHGFLPVRSVRLEGELKIDVSDTIDFNRFLTTEELGVKT